MSHRVHLTRGHHDGTSRARGYLDRAVGVVRPLVFALVLLALLPAVARADNCASFGDCFGTVVAALITGLGAGFATVLAGMGGFGHFFRGGYPDLPPNLAGPGQYGPYGNPVTDAHGDPTGLYTGTSGPSQPSRFTDPATGEGYGGTSAGPMIYFSQGIIKLAGDLVGHEGPGSSGGASSDAGNVGATQGGPAVYADPSRPPEHLRGH